MVVSTSVPGDNFLYFPGIGLHLQPYRTDVFDSKCNAELPIISLLCRLNILQEHSKRMFIVWTAEVYCFLPANILSTDGKLKSLMGGEELLQRISYTQRHITHNVGKGWISFQNLYRSNPHLKEVFQGFQMIILNSCSICKTWSMRNIAAFLLLIVPVSLVACCLLLLLITLKQQQWKAGKATKQCGSPFL